VAQLLWPQRTQEKKKIGFSLWMDEHNQKNRDETFPPIKAPRTDLPIAAFATTKMREKQQQMLARATTGTGSSQDKALPVRDCKATALRIRSHSVVTLAAIDSDNTIADSSTVNREAPNFWPSKPDLAACCQNIAAFLATHAANSTTNGINPVPTAGMIFCYMRIIFFVLQLEPECCVYAYIYINRLLSGTGNRLKIRPGNWKKILVGTTLLASKFVDDLSMKNRDFAKALNGWSLRRINQLEYNILAALKWKVYVPISEYTLRYFELAGPRVSTCDWHVDIKAVMPYFRIRSRQLKMLFDQILYSRSNKLVHI